jgi:hypothetical protein
VPVEGSAGEVVPIISVVVVILSLVCVLNCTGVVPSVDLPADVFIDDTPFVVFIVESDGTVGIEDIVSLLSDLYQLIILFSWHYW